MEICGMNDSACFGTAELIANDNPVTGNMY